MKKILVVGGAGYIGSHMVRMLQENDYTPIVLDDLSGGHKDAVSGAELIIGDLGDPQILNQIFSSHLIFGVMHFASFIQVGESMINPGKYYENTLAKTITLLNKLVEFKIKKFIFSSTAAIFGNPIDQLIDEDHPKNPINPYGKSKLMIESVLDDYSRAYDLESVCLRYFNAAGAEPDGSLGERHSPETHLIPLAIEAATTKVKSLKIFGTDYETKDGTCIRDYIHIKDIAKAHLLALKYLENDGKSLKLNLGNGSGYTVKEVIHAVNKVVGHEVPVEITGRRLGDPAVLVADSKKAANILGWKPNYPNLDEIVTHAYRIYISHQN